MAHLIAVTEQGKVRGKIWRNDYGENFYAFCGIPYAKAPVGKLRFKEPQTPDPWNNIFNATRLGPACPHIFKAFDYYQGNENNCLNLNIFTKQLNGNYPVMVYIHGGGFMEGSNDTRLYGPSHLLTADIVLVVINYRLGVFGFLSLEDRSLNVPGNSGLKDQVMALKWVQKNIKNFGGDPSNVTIFGESAGGASVHYLMLSPLAKGLFHKAIIQSGSALCPWARGKRNALDVARVLNYSETSELEILEKLFKEKASTLAKIPWKKYMFYVDTIHPYGPVIEYEHENAFLSKDPVEILKSGEYNKVPIMIGSNSFEGLIYEYITKVTDQKPSLTFERDIPYYLNITRGSDEEQEITNKIREFYFKNEKVSQNNIMKRYKITSDTFFTYGILKSVELMSYHHPVYLYRNSLDGDLGFFKRTTLNKYMKTALVFKTITAFLGIAALDNFVQHRLKTDVPGVSHADELFYLFSSLLSRRYERGSDEDISIQKFVKIWTDFAIYPTPTPKSEATLDNVIWKPIIEGSTGPVFNIDFKVELQEQNLEQEAFKFWDEIHKYKE